MNVLVIDYGMGNLGSVRRSLEECGARVVMSGDPEKVDEASCMVLPGVGSFADGMRNLSEKCLIAPIQQAVSEGVPLLGICLGMQLLADKGYEGGETAGLSLIAGEVRRLESRSPVERIPHIGWNELHFKKDDALFSSIPDVSDFYFVHSFHLVPRYAEDIAATTPYCGQFVSAVARKNIYGVQFHPEKSSKYGRKLLENFLAFSGVVKAAC